MSFNKLSYDNCTYNRHLKENISVLSFYLSPYRFEHKDKCRHQLGLVGGTDVSHVSGNLVDLESDLRGQTRFLSKCDKNAYKPVSPGSDILNDKTAPISTQLNHLPSCQMISYKEVPLATTVNYNKC